jgi:hypothetical protein
VPEQKPNRKPHHTVARAIIEVASIIFLFYSNLLMGQYTAGEESKPLGFALHQIFTGKSFAIAVASGLVGYVVFEYLRSRA